VGIDN